MQDLFITGHCYDLDFQVAFRLSEIKVGGCPSAHISAAVVAQQRSCIIPAAQVLLFINVRLRTATS